MGIVRILVEKQLDLDLNPIVRDSIVKIGISTLIRKHIKGDLSLSELDYTNLKNEVLDFILGRFQAYMKSKGFDTDIINSVVSTGETNLYRAFLKISSVNQLKQNPQFEDIMITFKRVGNIIPEDFEGEFSEKLLEKEEEKLLFEKYKQIKSEVEKLTEQGEYGKALSKLLELKEYVDKFFDNVMVMVKDEKIKTNRLSLLKKINDLFRKISDFTKINVQGGK